MFSLMTESLTNIHITSFEFEFEANTLTMNIMTKRITYTKREICKKVLHALYCEELMVTIYKSRASDLELHSCGTLEEDQKTTLFPRGEKNKLYSSISHAYGPYQSDKPP